MNAKRRRAQKNGARISPVVGIGALVVIALRVFLALALQSDAPQITPPVLEDATYFAEVQSESAIGRGPDLLPRGSAFYPRISASIPGVASGEFGTLGIVQSVLDGLAVLILGAWASRRWGTAAALVGMAIYALDPLGAFFAARLTPLSWTLPLFALALVFWNGPVGSLRAGPGGAAIFGLFCALGFAFSPLLFTVVAFLGFYERGANGPDDGFEGATSEAGGTETGSKSGASGTSAPSGASAPSAASAGRWVGAALTLVPLVAAAALIILSNSGKAQGGPTLSWGSGLSVYQSTNPATGGTARQLEAPSWGSDLSVQTDVWESLAREGTRYDVYTYYFSRGLQRIVEKPVETIGVILVKAAATLGATPLPDNGPSPVFAFDRGPSFLVYGNWSFALLLGLGLAGLFAASPSPERHRLRWGLIAVAAACLLGPTSAAARQPGLLVLAILAGSALAQPKSLLRPLPLGLLVAGLAGSVLLAQVSPTSSLTNPSEDLRLEATLSSREGDARGAVRNLEEAVRADAENLEARASLARLYQGEGSIERATQELETAYAADSTHAATLLALSNLEQAKGNADRALRMMSRLVNSRPNNPLYLNELGRMLLQSGRWDISKNFFIRALEIKPDYSVAQQNLALATDIEMRTERNIYPSDMRIASDDPVKDLFGEAMNAMLSEDFATADSLLAEAERAKPDNVVPLWMRAGYYDRVGDTEGAIRTLRRCNELAPCRPAVVEQLASQLLRVGRRDEAIRVLDECEESPAEPDFKGVYSQIKENLLNPQAPPTAP